MAGPGTFTVAGRTTLVAGTIAQSVPGVTANSNAWVQNIIPGGTLSAAYKAVCTTNTVTITSVTTGGATNNLDTSTVSYFVYGN